MSNAHGLHALMIQELHDINREAAAEPTHDPFSRGELRQVPAPFVVPQPVNRGTTAAVAAALMLLRRAVS